MSIDLTELRISGDDILPLDFGGLLQGPLGGPADRLERQGDRYSANVATPRMYIEPDGRRWSARLLRARKEGGIVAIHQPDLKVGAPGTPSVATATASGRSIPVQGLNRNYVIREGQWLNYIVGGLRYLDQAREEVIADASGNATITLQNLIRTPLTAGAVIDLATPCMEGWIEGDFSIPRATDRITSYTFTISEKA
jgi:hypothetical protein